MANSRNTLKENATIIMNETGKAANTAERIGSALLSIANYVDVYDERIRAINGSIVAEKTLTLDDITSHSYYELSGNTEYTVTLCASDVIGHILIFFNMSSTSDSTKTITYYNSYFGKTQTWTLAKQEVLVLIYDAYGRWVTLSKYANTL